MRGIERAWGALKGVLSNRELTIKAKNKGVLYEGAIVPTALYGAGRVRGRPRLGWMDGVKVALGNRGMTVEAARQ